MEIYNKLPQELQQIVHAYKKLHIPPAVKQLIETQYTLKHIYLSGNWIIMVQPNGRCTFPIYEKVKNGNVIQWIHLSDCYSKSCVLD